MGAVTQAQLLAEFPDYKPLVWYHNQETKCLEPHFSYFDKLELEGRLLERQNKDRKQMELFLEGEICN